MPIIKKRINFKKASKQLVEGRIRALRLLASEIIVGITRRTQSGRDVGNKGFKKYSPGYAKSKAKQFGGSRPNLTRTGNMLNSQNSKDIRGGVRLFFVGGEENRKALFNQKSRKFFGIDSAQQKRIRNQIKRIKR